MQNNTNRFVQGQDGCQCRFCRSSHRSLSCLCLTLSLYLYFGVCYDKILAFERSPFKLQTRKISPVEMFIFSLSHTHTHTHAQIWIPDLYEHFENYLSQVSVVCVKLCCDVCSGLKSPPRNTQQRFTESHNKDTRSNVLFCYPALLMMRKMSRLL